MKMTRTNKIQAVMNEIARSGCEWTIELQDEAESQIRKSDGKDTARAIAKRVIFSVSA